MRVGKQDTLVFCANTPYALIGVVNLGMNEPAIRFLVQR
jgi:hypothetical protein